MTADPLASMGCWPVTVELGGREYEIPGLSAARWWQVLVGDVDVTDLLPVGANDAIDEQLLNGTLSSAEMTETLTAALEEVVGRPLKSALYLVALAMHQWEAVSGRLALAGFRWDVMPIAAALDAIYFMRMENADEESRAEFLKNYDPEAALKAEKAAAQAAFAEMAGPKPVRSNAAPSAGTRARTPRPYRPRRPREQSSPPTEQP